ncbi:MAG TPA: DUF2442 domain-containing protein [Azospirillaceae bacterium]|nr:DUF2442 domain-containing protein [Azospirillaceae bacterium]
MTDRAIVHVDVTDDFVTVRLDDGRVVSTPLAWYPRLLAAPPEARARCEIVSAGLGVSWPDLDEDLSLAGMLRGEPARRRPGHLAAE